MSTIPYGIVGSEFRALVAAAWERTAKWLDISTWIALEVSLSREDRLDTFVSACVRGLDLNYRALETEGFFDGL